ncbi:MAG: outer membrane protein OmpA-like peptidoglycan-associated protein [Bacteroidia bacterium]
MSEGRIQYKGYGEKQPVDTNETSEGRAKNRRTEFKVLSGE